MLYCYILRHFCNVSHIKPIRVCNGLKTSKFFLLNLFCFIVKVFKIRKDFTHETISKCSNLRNKYLPDIICPIEVITNHNIPISLLRKKVLSNKSLNKLRIETNL